MKLSCEKRDRPTASPTTRPIATESAKAIASSQNVMRSAAGTPSVSNTLSSESSTRDGGLRNSGSIHQRAAISHSRSAAATIRSRVSQRRRIRVRCTARIGLVAFMAASPATRATS